MKAYRFKCWAFNLYFECIVKADNEDHAQHLVADGLSSGKIKLQMQVHLDETIGFT